MPVPGQTAQPTGTYTVNNDCTGTMTLNIPGATEADPAMTFRTNFILTEPRGAEGNLAGGIVGGTIVAQRPQILFVLQGGRFSGVGTGR